MKQYCDGNERPIKIGHTVFRQKFNEQALLLMDDNMIKAFSKKSWYIPVNQQWSSILVFIQKAECQWFRPRITDSCLPPIFSLISHISFVSLIELDLGKNYLKNIESLAFLHLDNIRTLKLLSNDIISIKAINKTNWKNLENMVLSGCHINSTDLQITRAKMNSNFQHLAFNYSSSSLLIENYNTLLKAETQKVNLLIFSNSPHLIFRKQFVRTLNQRFSTEKLIWANNILQFGKKT